MIIFEFIKIIIFIFLSFGLFFILINFWLNISPKAVDFKKLSAYECGFTTIGYARKLFFFIVKLFLILFNVELISIFLNNVIDISFLDVYADNIEDNNETKDTIKQEEDLKKKNDNFYFNSFVITGLIVTTGVVLYVLYVLFTGAPAVPAASGASAVSTKVSDLSGASAVSIISIVSAASAVSTNVSDLSGSSAVSTKVTDLSASLDLSGSSAVSTKVTDLSGSFLDVNAKVDTSTLRIDTKSPGLSSPLASPSPFDSGTGVEVAKVNKPPFKPNYRGSDSGSTNFYN